MKKITAVPLLLLLMIPVFLLTGSEFTMTIPSVSLAKTGTGEYTASFSVEYSGITGSYTDGITVPLPREQYKISGQIEDDSISETDFLFAGINYDLNNDGDTADSFTISKIRGVHYLEESPIKIIISPYKFNNLIVYDFFTSGKQERTTLVAPSALPLLVYEYDTKNNALTAGLGSKDVPLSFSMEHNPCVKVEVIKPLKSLNEKPAYRISGNACMLTCTNERLIEGYDDSWKSSVWAILPFALTGQNKNSFEVKIRAISPPFLVRVTAYFSIDQGITLASKPVSAIGK
ncbi:MAG TPA: hypothetical protein PK926_17150 [Spirochaetota bacterium]|nr:hypothetical protein [Spirochaetota bacterium]HPI90834.1 hypothetical protein [Spirochaetota bacterium]HPR47629.1 hypothetical protein [Spirochaetota bacterium]